MKTILVDTVDLARTFTLIARHDTHYFLEHELPAYLESLSVPTLPFRDYVERLRSGEYIPKASYSDKETNYVYLTIGQFSGDSVSFEDVTFLDASVGEQYLELQVTSGDIVITRSGTVGVAHIFRAPDEKIYIPSHHLAVVTVPKDDAHSTEYLRVFLQSEFARKYFWAFASGKSQKEISNWSIKTLPIPQCDRPAEVAQRVLEIENGIRGLLAAAARKQEEKEDFLVNAIRGAVTTVNSRDPSSKGLSVPLARAST